MSKRDFNDFYETLEHEFSDIDVTINSKGYKIDGNDGIKITAGYRDYKSADYFAYLNKTSLIIEFSNLQQHYENVEYKKQAIIRDCINLKKNERRIYDDFLKTLNHEIKNELCSKFKDTVSISENAEDKLSNVPEWIRDNNRSYFIIVSPFQPSKEEAAQKRKRKPVSESDFIRYLDNLSDKIKHDLPNHKYRKVIVITLTHFIKSL